MELSGLLSSLTSRGETLDERLARLASDESPAGAPDATTQRRLLAPWCKAFARGRFEALLRRLAWDGLQPADAARAFLRSDGLPAAGWTEELRSYAAAVRETAASDGSDEIPFVELWLPWVRVAAGALDDLPFTAAAKRDLETCLLGDIAAFSELAAYELFDAHRGRHGGYAVFIAECLHDPLTRIYEPFPALARHTVETVRQWREAAVELGRRFAADRQAIAEAFAGGRPTGDVESIRAGLSDRHGDGRQVLALELESGLRLVYKPRPVGLEVALAQWLEWCSAEGCEHLPRVPRVLGGEGYGWQEFVVQESGASRDEAEGYYRRAGALVAFAYVLRARDLHAENLVATRSGPVVVDAEMFLQPPRVVISTDPEAAEADASCLDSGLLLEPGRGAGGKSREWGGLRPEPQRRGPGTGRRWRHVNRDDMTVEPGEVDGELGENVLRIGDTPAPPEEFRGELADGFEHAYRFLLDRREALLAEDGPLELFHGAEVRILLRPSQDYGRILTLLTLPRNQRSGLQASLLCEALASVFAESERRPELWPLAVEERAALTSRDIPRFAINAESAALESAAGERVTGNFTASGLAAVRQRIGRLGEVDLTRQLGLLRRALEPPWTMAYAARSKSSRPAELESRCREWADAIAEELVATPLVEDGLGRGRLGVAFFLAAAGSNEAARELLEPGIVAPGLGGFSGLGSRVYALTWLARLLDDSELLGLAREAARGIDDEAIRQDRAYDLEGGSAGAILGLLALHETTGDEDALRRARACGDHLLARQELLASGGAAWRNAAGVALAGWAHGAAGIARALAALAEVDGTERYRVAAAAALGYERSLFDRERGNWPALMASGDDEPQRNWLVTWCHGAPGVALSRLMLPARFADATLAGELATALATTASRPPGDLDHLCCGTLGRAAVLLTAGQRLGEAKWTEAARRLTATVLDQATAEGRFRLRTDRLGRRELHPGFLKGLAGIGYHLLRVAGAELPDVLALELPSEARNRTEATP